MRMNTFMSEAIVLSRKRVKCLFQVAAPSGGVSESQGLAHKRGEREKRGIDRPTCITSAVM